MASVNHPCLMAARNEQKRPVRSRDIIQKHSDIHRPWFRHFIITFPGSVILMPLPNITIKSSFGIDLELMHIQVPLQKLGDRLYQAGMRAKAAEAFIIGMSSKSGSGHTRCFAPDFFTLHGVDGICLSF